MHAHSAGNRRCGCVASERWSTSFPGHLKPIRTQDDADQREHGCKQHVSPLELAVGHDHPEDKQYGSDGDWHVNLSQC